MGSSPAGRANIRFQPNWFPGPLNARASTCDSTAWSRREVGSVSWPRHFATNGSDASQDRLMLAGSTGSFAARPTPLPPGPRRATGQTEPRHPRDAQGAHRTSARCRHLRSTFAWKGDGPMLGPRKMFGPRRPRDQGPGDWRIALGSTDARRSRRTCRSTGIRLCSGRPTSRRRVTTRRPGSPSAPLEGVWVPVGSRSGVLGEASAMARSLRALLLGLRIGALDAPVRHAERRLGGRGGRR